jgi:lysophospholipid acyltransferase (LPLAT)-like uncharacterized protein
MKLVWLNRIALALLPPVGAAVIKMLGKTMRVTVRGDAAVEKLYREGKHIILAFWHGRQLMIPLVYHGSEVHVLISQHRDGELISQIMARFGYRSVRGSSTRGGTLALRQLIKLGRSGVDLAITPDGPKGPRQVAQAGVIHLARATGLPILPVTFSCSKKNSSKVGIASCSPTPSGAVSFCGATRSGCRLTPRPRKWTRSAASWKPC